MTLPNTDENMKIIISITVLILTRSVKPPQNHQHQKNYEIKLQLYGNIHSCKMIYLYIYINLLYRFKETKLYADICNIMVE